MKKIHYVNLGMPKNGTTSIFFALMSHPLVDFKGIKENYSLLIDGVSIQEYRDYYKDYNISLNFCPMMWAADSLIVNEISSVATHFSIIFRNPYDYVESLYNYSIHNESYESFVDILLETNQLDYAGILSRWELTIHSKPFIILYYDDLVDNETLVINQIVEFIGLPKNSSTVVPLNVNRRKNSKFIPTENQILRINSLIEKFEINTNKNFSHWKK